MKSINKAAKKELRDTICLLTLDLKPPWSNAKRKDSADKEFQTI